MPVEVRTVNDNDGRQWRQGPEDHDWHKSSGVVKSQPPKYSSENFQGFVVKGSESVKDPDTGLYSQWVGVMKNGKFDWEEVGTGVPISGFATPSEFKVKEILKLYSDLRPDFLRGYHGYYMIRRPLGGVTLRWNGSDLYNLDGSPFIIGSQDDRADKKILTDFTKDWPTDMAFDGILYIPFDVSSAAPSGAPAGVEQVKLLPIIAEYSKLTPTEKWPNKYTTGTNLFGQESSEDDAAAKIKEIEPVTAAIDAWMKDDRAGAAVKDSISKNRFMRDLLVNYEKGDKLKGTGTEAAWDMAKFMVMDCWSVKEGTPFRKRVQKIESRISTTKQANLVLPQYTTMSNADIMWKVFATLLSYESIAIVDPNWVRSDVTLQMRSKPLRQKEIVTEYSGILKGFKMSDDKGTGAGKDANRLKAFIVESESDGEILVEATNVTRGQKVVPARYWVLGDPNVQNIVHFEKLERVDGKDQEYKFKYMEVRATK